MTKRADILTLEVGSTLTKATAFAEDHLLGRAVALTTTEDVSVGVGRSLERLASDCGVGPSGAGEVLAASSAAGGLRMTVHGLTRDLTARAAEEAALGAGANIKLITAGRISEREQSKVEAARPNLIMLAGGVEYGDEETVLANAKLIARLDVDCPVVYAGNVALREEVAAAFSSGGRELHVVDNVYPRFDELNVGPVRELIQKLFSERLTIAPGMDELRRLAKGGVMPVPAACLQAAEVLSETAGDLVVVDVGGATTDVHSIVEGPSEGNLDPQIRSRRTVEGDLGLYVSAGSVWRGMGRQGEPSPLSALPGTAGEEALSQELAGEAAQLALVRHAGRVIHGALLPDGRVPVRGRDLRGVGLVVGTGGGLAGLAGGLECLREAIRHRGTESLLPGADADVRIDRHYVFSACGTFARKYPDLATSAMLQSIGAEGAWS